MNLNNVAIAMFTILSAFAVVAVVPQGTAYADCSGGTILTLRPWYSGLTMDGDCAIESPSDETSQKKFVWTIALNIVEDLLQIAAYVSFGFLIYGGFIYMISAGTPEKATSARKIITNSIVGLVVAMFAVMLVSVVARTALGIS